MLRGRDMTVSETIYRKRRALRLTQRELALLAGVSIPLVIRMEAGQSVTLDSLALVLDSLCLELQVVERRPW